MDRHLPDAPRPPAANALLRPIPAAIPAALRAVERWICWRARPRADGKFDKVPHRPQTGRPCDALDPANWSSFDQALAALGQHRLDGIGIVLTGEDALAGIDLDRCRDAGGVITPWAREIVAALDSYTEISPSGRGLRILAVGALPPGRRATAGLEMYDRARFLTITGHHLAGTPATIERRDDALRAVHARHFGEEAAPALASAPVEQTAGRGDPPSLDEVRAMLRCIPPRLTYEAWLHVLMAVHEAYPGAEGVALCEDWSPGDAGEIAKKFASFKRQGVGVGTLIHVAKQHGWRPAERPTPVTVLPSPAPSCGAQAASHSGPPTPPNRPDLAAVPEEIRRYIDALAERLERERREHAATRQERDALREENRELRRERNADRDRYRLRLHVLHNRTIKPATRLAAVGLADVLEDAQRRGKTEADGWTPAYAAAIAEQAGLEARSVPALTKELDALGLVEKETELHRKTVQAEDGQPKSVLCSVSRFRPAGGSVAAMLRRAATITAPARHHGGERPKAPAPARPWRCPDHPQAPHVATCTVCGTIGDERELVAMGPNEDAGCGAQVASHSDGADDALGASPMELTSMEPQVASHSPAGQAAGRRVLGERVAMGEPAGVAGSPPLSAHDGAAASGGSAAPHADRTGHQHGMAWAAGGVLGAVPGSAPVRGNGGHRHGS